MTVPVKEHIETIKTLLKEEITDGTAVGLELSDLSQMDFDEAEVYDIIRDMEGLATVHSDDRRIEPAKVEELEFLLSELEDKV